MVKRKGSIVAHSEFFTLEKAQSKVWIKKPLTLYSMLEPCLMCLGATMQTDVKNIVYGMEATPDGGVRYIDTINTINKMNQFSPNIKGGLFVQESIRLMNMFLQVHPSSPAVPYVKELLKTYE